MKKTKNMNETEYDPLPLTNDLVFKAIFGREDPDSKKALIGLLNLILDRENNPIAEITILNPFVITEYIKSKQSSMDITLKTSDGEVINIEMQARDEGSSYINRSLFYAGKVLQLTLSRGEDYAMMEASKVISLLTKPLFLEHDDYHSVYVLKERKGNGELTELFQMDYLELSKIDPDKKPIEKMNKLEQFCLYSYNVGKDSKKGRYYTEKALQLGGEVVAMTHNALIKVTDEERQYVKEMMRDKYERDQISRLKDAERTGQARGEKIGRIDEMARSVGALMKNKNLNEEQAMDALNVPMEDREVCKAQLPQQW